VALQLRQLGFPHAEALQGGLNAWRSAYPVEPTSDTAA
jgi:rhodanese-related sulfurtransferase